MPSHAESCSSNGIHVVRACMYGCEVIHSMRGVHVVRNCSLSTPLHYGKHSMNCLLLQRVRQVQCSPCICQVMYRTEVLAVAAHPRATLVTVVAMHTVPVPCNAQSHRCSGCDANGLPIMVCIMELKAANGCY